MDGEVVKKEPLIPRRRGCTTDGYLYSYKIIVDSDLTVEQMLEELTEREEDLGLGEDARLDRRITHENFPHNHEGDIENIVELILSDDDRGKRFKKLVVEIDDLGMRPSTLKELLALFTLFGDQMDGQPVLALGSVWTDLDGRQYSPLMSGDDRELSLQPLDEYFRSDFLYLVVRKL